ncbi:serine/threonine-protein kinase [Streptomyces sp. NRRL B-24720]|uniref:serine/threonine-protein kinase n=1 Tax=Streptomyces sp. NRRL B-24720 TaxID=1476876 RepID=UPI00099C1E2A|nr:serine/threonine-protein kinase [Streptomyces sp. NRRL B-24720]
MTVLVRSDARVLNERYEMRQRIGGGAMGEVWLAYDSEARRSVAVKLIHRELVESHAPEEAIRRFEQEAELLARLRHPGIPAFLDARLGLGVDEPYLVMELILGQDLTEIVEDRGALSEDEVVSIAVQICHVLEYTHAIPVIHRDLKPANIMLTDYRRVMVLDFGVARMFRTDDARLTQHDRVLGTVAYMPPEQCEGLDVNPRSDLYSLSCLLYELLTGVPPFTGNVTRVMYHHQHQAPISISVLRPGVNPALESVIMAGLEKRASDRPATAREFRERIGSQPLEFEKSGHAPSHDSIQIPNVHSPGHNVTETLPLPVRVIQAQALFDEGLIVQSMPIFASLVQELEELGSEYATEAAKCRFSHARCQAHLGLQQDALKGLQALAEHLRVSSSPDDRLLLEVRFQVGQLLLVLGDKRGISEFAEVFRILKAADRPGDAHLLVEVRRALTRASIG